jgi:hypothetical protein
MFDESKKEHDVGFIPHLIDINEIKNRYPNEFIINLNTTDPQDIVTQITKCRRIVSSSLHGIITAHAYGIPAAWANSNKLITRYSNTKFLDYYQSINTPSIMSTFDDPIFDLGTLDINYIIKVFKEYAYELKS